MRQGKRSKLFVKVFLSVFLLQTALGAGLLVFLYKVMPEGYDFERGNRLEEEMRDFAEKNKYISSEDYGPALDAFLEKHKDSGLTAYLTDKDSMDNSDYWNTVHKTNSKLSLNSFAQLKEYNAKVYGSDEPQLYLSQIIPVFITDEDNKEYGIMFRYVTPKENFASDVIVEYLPWFILIIVTVALISAYIFSTVFVRPIKKISRVAEDLSKLDFSARCDCKRNDEFGLIAGSLDNLSSELQKTLKELNEQNEMLEKEIEKSNLLESQRSMFFSSAAHELKTPLSIADGQLSGMIDNVGVYSDRDTYLRKCLANVRRMEKTVKDILAVSRLQAGSLPSGDRVEISRMISELMTVYEDLFEAAGIVTETDVPQDLYASGNYELLKDAAGALISNACNYSPRGAEVSVRAFRTGGDITIEVRNTGAHIDEEHLPRLHEAFYRTDMSRNSHTGGSGLGLYLVKLVAESMGGSCHIENVEDGVSSSLTIASEAS